MLAEIKTIKIFKIGFAKITATDLHLFPEMKFGHPNVGFLYESATNLHPIYLIFDEEKLSQHLVVMFQLWIGDQLALVEDEEM